MGIKDTFDEENADFSAMSKDALQQDPRLYVSEVVHKASFERIEGTDVFAAIKVPKKNSRARTEPDPIPFIVEHPFVFMILYKDQTLFMGKVTSL